MRSSIIVDNEEFLISEGFLDCLVVNKKTGMWTVLFAEEGIDRWLDTISSFPKEVSEKFINSNIFSSCEEEEKELLLKVFKKDAYITYTAEAFLYGEMVATTIEYSTEKELREEIDKIFNKEYLTVEIYRTINEPDQNGEIKQHHSFVCEI